MNPIKKAAKILVSRLDFWEHCKTVSPDFYFEERWHLKLICDTIQALYQGRIQKPTEFEADEKTIIPWQIVSVHNPLWITCKKLMLNVPPQHGKTRTLVNFSSWVFGQNPKEKIICGSYNDATASDFSRYTRDAIISTGFDSDGIFYYDIFPKTKIKKGNAGFEKWALEGSHFSYLGVGIGGSVTSKGGSILIVDDPVKSAEEAFNENALEKVWLWYSSTFSSRVAAKDGEPIEILNMTRWSDKDPCGRILDSSAKKDWYVLKLQAYNEATDTMLCPSLFSKKRFESQRLLVYPQIFNANYQQETIEETGVLFPKTELNRFDLEDFKTDGLIGRLGYIDVADQGDDALSFPTANIFPMKIFIKDVLFSDDGVEFTLPACAEFIYENNIDYTRIESNNQGKLFKQMLEEFVEASKLLSAANVTAKHTRIILISGFIKKYFWFLSDKDIVVGSAYHKFFKQLTSYMKDGSSKHDDAPDSLAGLAKFIRAMYKQFRPTKEEIKEEVDTQTELEKK